MNPEKIAKFARMFPKFWALALVLVFGLNISSHAQSLNENVHKAAYLLSFVDFVHWEKADKTPIVIGLVGDTAMAEDLEQLIVHKRKMGARKDYEIRIVDRQNLDLTGIDVLYVSEGTQPLWKDIIPQAKQLCILTVGDSSEFLDAGGLIEFVIHKNRLRFTLNLESAPDYRIAMSSKLAQLAVGS